MAQLTQQQNIKRLKTLTEDQLREELFQNGYTGNDDGNGGWDSLDDLSAETLYDKLVEMYEVFPEKLPEVEAAAPEPIIPNDHDRHQLTAFDLRTDIWHISALYSTSHYAGGIIAILLLALNHSLFHYTPTIKRMEGTQNPKWVKQSKKELRHLIDIYAHHFTEEQLAELRKRFA